MSMSVVGTIVCLRVPCLGNPAGAIGVCVNLYDEGGTFVLFENGNYDGFSADEQKRFLTEIGFSPDVSGYVFTNVMKLSRHFEEGIFDSVFKSEEWVNKG